MRGAKRFAASESLPDTNDSAFRNKRKMEGPSFGVYGAEPSQPPSNAMSQLDPKRAETSRQHVRALNAQFASWIQAQLKNHPDELWEDGIRDYLAHASDILDKFSDVVKWLKENAGKGGSSAKSLSTEMKTESDMKNNDNKVFQGKAGIFSPITDTSFSSPWSSGALSNNQSTGGLFSNSQSTGGLFSSSQSSGGLFSNNQSSSGLFSNSQSSSGLFSNSQSSGGLFSNSQSSGGLFSNSQSSGGLFSSSQSSGGLFSNSQSSGGLFSNSQSSSLVTSSQNSGLLSSSQSTGLFSNNQTSGLFSSSQNSEVPRANQSFGLFSSSQNLGSSNQTSGLFSSNQTTGLFSSNQSTGLFSNNHSMGSFTNSATPLFGGQNTTTTNQNASDDADDENEEERPSSPSVKKAEEKGIVVVHEVKCKLYVKSTDPEDKDTWKDKGTGQLSIKCAEGIGKGTKESKPTIVVRNDVGKVLLNALLYPGIKTNAQKNSIVAIFHIAGNDGVVVGRTFLIRTKTAEDRSKLEAAIQEYAPAS